MGIVLHARSRAMGGEDVVGEVKGVEEVGEARKSLFFFDCWWALFGNRAAERPWDSAARVQHSETHAGGRRKKTKTLA